MTTRKQTALENIRYQIADEICEAAAWINAQNVQDGISERWSDDPHWWVEYAKRQFGNKSISALRYWRSYYWDTQGYGWIAHKMEFAEWEREQEEKAYEDKWQQRRENMALA